MLQRANSVGLGMIEIMISIVIIMTFILATDQVFQYSDSNRAALQLTYDLTLVRNNVMNILSQPEVWNQIKINNSGMACLRNGTDCAGVAGGTFDIYEFNGAAVSTLYAPTTGANIGLTKSVTQCATFVAPGNLGDPLCPIRLDLNWTPICPTAGACTNPNVKITGVFTINTPEAKKVININRLNFTLIQ